jgi:3',5'-cyclic AMP phosphodiesterase CpdA
VRRLLHLSDLHFDRIDHAIMEPLVGLAHQVQPHLLVISGDITQRARAKQFRLARDFLERLPGPRLIVPGNHDVPLFNLLARFFDPLRNYRRFISQDLQPFFGDDEIAVLGINTARSLTHKGGRIGTRQVGEVGQRFKGIPPAVAKVVVTHHPFDLPDPLRRRDLVGRAGLAMREFARSGVDLLLCGHFHSSQAILTSTHYRIGSYSAVVVQASTATSTRVRKEPNAFNLIEVEKSRIVVRPYSWDSSTSNFRPRPDQAFIKAPTGWLPG